MLSLAELLPLWNALSRIAADPGPVHLWRPSDRWDRRAQEAHPVPTAVVCLQGVSRHGGPGQQRCDLQAGESLLIEPGCLHSHAPLRGQSAYLGVGNDAGVCDLELHAAGDEVDLSVPQEPSRQLLAEAFAAATPGAARVRMATLLQQILREPLSDRPPLPPPVLAMRACIRERSLQRIGAEEVVAASGLGRSAAFELFKRHYGRSPHAVLEERRCRVAGSLLARGCPVAETARRVGYDRVQTFGRAYRRVTGRAPADDLGPAWVISAGGAGSWPAV